ncbi:MAG: site-specific integrase [Selenomonadaceae bacterium]|nr:site-specific integrase [Selenomonadaceae bacterium]
MGRRNAGEGVIYQDKNRGLWIYQVSYKDSNGSAKRKKFAAKTKHEAMEKGKAFLMANQQGSILLKADMTIADWIDEWMENYVKPRIRPRTFEKYWSSLKNYIVPKFGNLKLAALDASSLQKHFNSLLVNGRADGNALSPSTVRAARRYFSMCVDDAVREGLVLRNVVRLTKSPKLTRKEIVVLTRDEVTTLIEGARQINNEFMRNMMPEILSFTVKTGLRQGEVFGLKWEDVDFKNSCVFIRRSLAHVVGRGVVFQEPKTKNSRRRVLLMLEDVQSLKEYREWQKNYADELGDKFARNGLIFTSPFGEPISPTNFSRRYFKPLLKKCNINSDFTFHGLRHTHATLLLQQGVNPKIVQERLGHSSIKVTMDTYSHVLPDMQRQAVDALRELFK